MAAAIRPPVQQAEIDRARDVYRQWGREIALLMCAKSLPQLFCHRPVAEALDRSNAASLERFVVDSLQSLFDVVIRGDSSPTQTEWAEQIDREDLPGVLTALAVWNLDGLARLRIGLSKEDKEATLAAWRESGLRLGLDEGLLPASLAEAIGLVQTIERRQFARSTASVRLVRRLLSTMNDLLPWYLKGVPLHLMRALMRPELGSMLEVPRRWALTPLVIRFLFALRGDSDELSAPRRTVRWVGGHLIRGIVSARRARDEEGGGLCLPDRPQSDSVSAAGTPPGPVPQPCPWSPKSYEWRPGVVVRAGLAEINGESTYCEELGEDGTPLVFVHGLGLDHSYWRPQMEFLAPRRRVLAYDTRGHGRSIRESTDELDFEQLVDDLHQVITVFGLGRPVIVGHGAGGVICVRAAIKYPSSISGLVLLDTPDADSPSTEPFGSLLFRAGLRLSDLLRPARSGVPLVGMWRRSFFSRRFLATDREAVGRWQRQFRGNSPRVLLAALRAQARLRPVAPLLSGIGVPMLGFWGTEDKACPRWPMDRYVARIPNAEPLQPVRGSGHMTLTEAPEIINQGIEEFLQGHAL